MTGNAVVVNFSGGETSPRSRARFDQPWYQTSAKKLLNFIAEVQGPARFRPGFVYGYQTRLGANARGFDFEINDVLAYLLEFTPGYMRVRNPLTQALLTTTRATITSVTAAATAVVTVVSATGLSNGKEVVLSGMVGMPEINNKQFLVAGISGTTFHLADPVTGALLNTAAYPAAGTAGYADVVYELTTPYSALDLLSLQVAATDGRMYLVCPRQVPQKLTVDAYGTFTISAYARTNDPFALSAAAVTITDVRPVWIEDQRLGAAATLTPAADTGTGITFTTSASVFSSTDVGKYIRSLIAQSDTRVASTATLTLSGVAGVITATASAAVFSSSDVGAYIRDLTAGAGLKGYAQITAFTSSTVVTCTVLSNFAALGPIASGGWAIESAGYAKITAVVDDKHATCTITSSFGATTAIASGSWAIVTAETQMTLANNSVVNASLTYIISSVGGATQANGSTYYLVPIDISSVSSGQRFYLRDTANAAIDSSAWGTYTSGGIATPSSSQASLTLTGVTRGTTTVVSFSAGAVVNPNVGYTFSSVGGTTQLNGQTYWLKSESDGVHITLVDGTEVDSSGWGAWTAGGIAVASAENPLTVSFYEGRLGFGGTNQRPDCLFLSRSPDNNGNSRYDDFTGGTTADFACFFQLAPTGGSASFISWMRGGPDYLFVGTFGGPYRVSGSGLDIPITPSSINVRQFDTAGCEETAPAGLQQMFFVQRAGATLRSIKVINPYLATFESVDMCLNAEQIGYSPIQRVVLQRGRPDVLWVYCADGTLAGMSVHLTVQASDTLTGWHRHKIGGVNAKVVDIVTVERQTGFDQLWAVVQRTINGATRCYFEVMADDVTFPDVEDFFGASGPIVAPSDDPQYNNVSTTDGSKALDLARWANAVWRLQDHYVHMDSEVSYDGSARGVAAAATLTPSAVGAAQVEGQAAIPITLTASQAVFAAGDVGSEIWVKPSVTTGVGAGRATITAFTSSTVVSAVVTVPFSSVSAVAAGDWYFAVSTFYGFGHLEGSQVAVVVDGAVFSEGGQTGDAAFPAITVTRGTITLPAGDLGQQPRAAVLRAGLPYTGIIETHNLEMGGRSGPAQSKPRNIAEIYIRFMNSLGCEYGTDLYALDKIDHRLSDANSDRPAPVFSGLRRVNFEDSWSGLDDATREKNVFVCQRLPLPAVVQFLDLNYSTADDGGAE